MLGDTEQERGRSQDVHVDDYRLPDEIAPYIDESLAGLTTRYAALYDMPPTELFSRLRLNRKMTLSSILALDPSSSNGSAIMHLLNVPHERRSVMSTFSGKPLVHNILGTEVPFGMASNKVRRCCARCLASEPYHRASWFVAALPACPVHGEKLLDRCPSCSQPLRWGAKSVIACSNVRCGLDLRECSGERVSERSQRVLTGLSALLCGGTHPAGLGFVDTVKVCTRIGALRTNFGKLSNATVLVSERPDAFLQILEVGWDTITPWPTAFDTYLDELITQSRGTKVAGLKGSYKPLMGALSHNADQEVWAGLLKARMVDRLVERGGVAVRTSLVRKRGSGGLESERRLTLGEAAKVAGISVTTMDRLARSANLEGNANTKWGQRRFLRSEIEALGKEYRASAEAVFRSRANPDRPEGPESEYLSQRAGAVFLGISVKTMVRLVASGVLSPGTNDRYLASMRMFRRADLRALIERLEASSVDLPRVAKSGKEHRLMGRGGLRDGVSYADLLSAFLAGKIRPIAVLTTTQGLSRYLFRRQAPDNGASS